MGKAALLAELAELKRKLSDVNDKIAELESILENLSAVSTEIKYLLNSEESIKAAYNLAGKPYGEEATNEEKLLTDTSTKYEAQKTDMMTKLKAKIESLKSEAVGFRIGMNIVSRELAMTKED